MQTQLPKAQWDIVSNTNFEPVRPYQFAAIFIPPPAIATSTLVRSTEANGNSVNPPVVVQSTTPAYGLFSTLRTATIPSIQISPQEDQVQGGPIYYANKIASLPQATTQHREYQGWYAYRSIWEWARQAYNFSQMTIGYQYQYKGGLIILNTPSFEGEYQVQQALLSSNADAVSLAQNLTYDEFWVFVNAWPTQTPEVSFDYAGTNLLNYSVQWQYDRLLTSKDIYQMTQNGQNMTNEIPVSELNTVVQYLVGNITQ